MTVHEDITAQGSHAGEPAEEPPDERAGALRKRYLLGRFWKSAVGFWGGGGDGLSWLLGGLLLLISLLNLATSYGMNVWYRGMFDALEKRDSQTVLLLSVAYFALLAMSVLFSVLLVYARMTAQRRWRAWLNKHLIDRWLAKGRYYQLNLVGGDHKNPEYRIADDVRIATESPIEFATGMTAALLSAATFIVVLWTIGGALTLQMGGVVVTIPGFLVIAAIIYAVAASGSMIVIGKHFILVAENKNQAEAEYRYALTRLRENGESIALIRGEEEERNGLDTSFRKVLRGWRNLCIQNMRTTLVSQTSSYVAPVLPIILCAPKFLDGSMTLGQVMQAASAFTIVQAAFNWLVDNYPRLAEWGASARRVASLELSLDALDRAETGFGLINREREEGAALRLRNLSVTLDDGRAVVKDAEVAIMPGEKVLITGESGAGKSTLVRAIAGLWPWGDGDIRIRSGAKLFLLPQRPYIPIGPLRRAATYPDAAESRSTQEIVEAFDKVGLGYLADRLDEEGPWDQILSGGEKQRLGFARILLHGPDIIVLDEATAALDPASQDRLLQLLCERERMTVLSVGHAPELESFHNRKVVLERHRGGAKLVSNPDFVPKPSRLRRWLRRRDYVPKAA
jgi:putative ATP-binding cassette transporter